MMAKNRSGFVVAYGPSENVPVALTGTFAKLKAELDLHGLDGEAIAARLAYFYWALTAQTEEQRVQLYHARGLAVMRGDTSELTQIFRACLTKSLRDSSGITSPV
jgi:hypothetical protein